jgi:hypothetical protein
MTSLNLLIHVLLQKQNKLKSKHTSLLSPNTCLHQPHHTLVFSFKGIN